MRQERPSCQVVITVQWNTEYYDFHIVESHFKTISDLYQKKFRLSNSEANKSIIWKQPGNHLLSGLVSLVLYPHSLRLEPKFKNSLFQEATFLYLFSKFRKNFRN